MSNKYTETGTLKEKFKTNSRFIKSSNPGEIEKTEKLPRKYIRGY